MAALSGWASIIKLGTVCFWLLWATNDVAIGISFVSRILSVHACGSTVVFRQNHWARRKERLDLRIKEMGGDLPHWTHHDLRRSAATKMAELGIAPHIIEAVLNHISGHKSGVAGIYNRASYTEEKKRALQRWADHIEEVVNG